MTKVTQHLCPGVESKTIVSTAAVAAAAADAAEADLIMYKGSVPCIMYVTRAPLHESDVGRLC